jgi:hypothetical protein
MICPHIVLKNESLNRETVNDLDELYIVMRRYELSDELEKEFSVVKTLYNVNGLASGKHPRISVPREDPYAYVQRRKTSSAFASAVDDDDEGERKYGNKENQSYVANQAKSGSKPNKPVQYFWQLDPYVSHDGMPPPEHIYNYNGDNLDFLADEDNTAWHGCFFRLGTVTQCHGAFVWNTEIANIAKKYLYPDSDNEDYKRYGNRLADVIIQLRT